MARCLIAIAAVGLGCGEDIELSRQGIADEDAGPVGGACEPGNTECNNCIDDDVDGLIDGFDPECTGAADNDEGSFDTDIPGDNRDLVNQDCFFDGNSGAGNDECELHLCCLLDECPDGLPGGNFDPASDCPPISQNCQETCLPITPPGCDCFGCCTVCEGATCVDILINTTAAPGCSQETLDDPGACPTCTKIAECTSTECDPANCVLCPGQTVDDLPPQCAENECPGLTQCSTSEQCGAGQFCSVGCCIGVIE